MLALACSKVWDKDLYSKLERALDVTMLFITEKSELNYENLKNKNIHKIYFPHWSYIIKKEIYENFGSSDFLVPIVGKD